MFILADIVFVLKIWDYTKTDSRTFAKDIFTNIFTISMRICYIQWTAKEDTKR